MLLTCFSRNGGLPKRLKNLCQFYSGNTSWARSKHRALQRHANVQGVLPVSGKVIGRCGLFTFVSVSALLFGSTVWSFEHWRARSWRLKHGHDGSGDRLRFSTQVRSKKTRILVRQTLPSKRCILGYVVFGVSLNLVFSILAIVACNLVVFIGHRSPLQSIFLRYFVNSPYGPTPALSMLLSVFSHHSPFHLAINMYVLHSFTSTLINILGPGDFIYLFVGGGAFGEPNYDGIYCSLSQVLQWWWYGRNMETSKHSCLSVAQVAWGMIRMDLALRTNEQLYSSGGVFCQHTQKHLVCYATFLSGFGYSLFFLLQLSEWLY
ncbi:hypothetical protein T265_14096, partial [Opisthorchis viverrini]